MQEIMGYIRRAVEEYRMIEDGDTVAVGVSGGKDSVALLAGLVSKEAVVSTLGVSLAGEGPLAAALAARFSPLSAAAFLVFCALYAPCVSALATMRRELHSTWRALAAALLQTAVAYAAALAVFQLGTLAQNLVGLL